MNVELFTASGGLAAGFRAAGVDFDLAFDRDADACTSYERNLGERPVQMDVEDLLRLVRAGWRPGPIGLLAADPPCTPWSRAGKRQGLADERDALEETVELIRMLRPACYLIGSTGAGGEAIEPARGPRVVAPPAYLFGGGGRFDPHWWLRRGVRRNQRERRRDRRRAG